MRSHGRMRLARVGVVIRREGEGTWVGLDSAMGSSGVIQFPIPSSPKSLPLSLLL